jgi:hypothetical protein
MDRVDTLDPEGFLSLWRRVWPHLVRKVEAILSLDASNREVLRTAQVAELAASIPFWSGCPNPLRKAYYIVLPLVADAAGHDILDANPDDYAEDRFRRLEEIRLICSGGNQERLAQGMNRLAGVMYWDCVQDQQLDKLLGKRGPDERYAREALAALAVERKPDAVYDAILPSTERIWWWGP